MGIQLSTFNLLLLFNSQLYYKMFTFVIVGALLSVAMSSAAPKAMPKAAAEAKPAPYWYGDADTNCEDWKTSCHLPQVYRVCASTCGVAYPALAYDYGYGAGYDYAYGAYPYAAGYAAYDYAAYPYAYDVYGRATRYYKKK